jgi:SAM-dependent methyltransferase
MKPPIEGYISSSNSDVVVNALEEDVIGHIDALNASYVAGWACQANHSEEIVEVFLNGVAIGTTKCDVDRPDVQSAGFRRRSGFYFKLAGVLNPSENNRIYVRAVGSDRLLHGPSLLVKEFARERMKQDGFDFSAALFVATAYSYVLDGTSVVVTGEVKTNGAPPATIRAIRGGKLVNAQFQKLDSMSVLNAFGIGVYSYSARFDLSAEPRLEFDFANPNPGGFRPICAIPGLGGLDSFAPSDESRKRVVGTMTSNNYITLAYTSAALLWNLAESEGKEGAWLDWGCGPGRTAIPLKRVFAKNWEICGCDVDDFNINVLKKLDAEIPAVVADLFPPLPYENNSFDVVHGISVLTHLTEDNQELWIEELARVLKPGGLALLTTHGELAVLISEFIDGTSPIYSAFTRRGISDEIIDDVLGTTFNDKSYYRSTFQTANHARGLFGRQFDIVRIITGGHNNHQDLWVLRRKLL